MTAMTDEQLLEGFKNHVRLYSGLGRAKMIEIVDAQFGKGDHDWQFYANGTFCNRCGASAGSGQECKR